MMLAILTACLLNSSSASAVSAVQEPWAVMTAQSVMAVRSGIRHIYERLGRKDLIAELDKSALTHLLSGDLNGLDLKRPLGCLVVPNQEGKGTLLAFIPATGEQLFLEFLKRHSYVVTTDNQVRPTVAIPHIGTMHIRYDHKYAWLALEARDLDAALPDPEQIIPAVHRQTHLATTVFLDRLPANQRNEWLAHGQQALNFLVKGEALGLGKLTETLALPLAGLMLNRLAREATELTMLAHTDGKADVLKAQLLISPKPGSHMLAQMQHRASEPLHYEIPASLWARLRGKPAQEAEAAAQTAFKNGQSDKLTMEIKGDQKIVVQAEMSGAFLEYQAALSQIESSREKRPSRRERRRDPSR